MSGYLFQNTKNCLILNQQFFNLFCNKVAKRQLLTPRLTVETVDAMQRCTLHMQNERSLARGREMQFHPELLLERRGPPQPSSSHHPVCVTPSHPPALSRPSASLNSLKQQNPNNLSARFVFCHFCQLHQPASAEGGTKA